MKFSIEDILTQWLAEHCKEGVKGKINFDSIKTTPSAHFFKLIEETKVEESKSLSHDIPNPTDKPITFPLELGEIKKKIIAHDFTTEMHASGSIGVNVGFVTASVEAGVSISGGVSRSTETTSTTKIAPPVTIKPQHTLHLEIKEIKNQRKERWSAGLEVSGVVIFDFGDEKVIFDDKKDQFVKSKKGEKKISRELSHFSGLLKKEAEIKKIKFTAHSEKLTFQQEFICTIPSIHSMIVPTQNPLPDYDPKKHGVLAKMVEEKSGKSNEFNIKLEVTGVMYSATADDYEKLSKLDGAKAFMKEMTEANKELNEFAITKGSEAYTAVMESLAKLSKTLQSGLKVTDDSKLRGTLFDVKEKKEEKSEKGLPNSSVAKLGVTTDD